METKRPRAPSPTAMAGSPAPPPSPAPSSAGAPLAFTGSSERDVALAKSFWNSVTLQPPLESRLGARRGSVCNGASGSRKSSVTTATAGRATPSAASSANDKREEDRHLETEKNGWKGQCLEKAKKREEIIALLKKQREERILLQHATGTRTKPKETLSRPHKPKGKTQQREQETDECSRKEKKEPSDLEDEESVKALP